MEKKLSGTQTKIQIKGSMVNMKKQEKCLELKPQ